MGGETMTGEMPAIPEDTIDLGERLDPVRTLLRRAASGDISAASSLVDVMGPRIHGLALHVLGSSTKATKLTVWVLRSSLEDAAQLAASGLPGEAAVLDRARRAALSTSPSGDVRSLVAPDMVADRTRDRREVDVVRVLLALDPAQRAVVESAAQGRFAYTGAEREQGALLLAHVLDQLVPFGGTEQQAAPQLRGLAALDALALADGSERRRLRDLARGAEGAVVHRHAIEAAARLTLLTAVAPSRDLRIAVLEGFAPSAPPPLATAPVPPRPGPTASAQTAESAPPAGSATPAEPVMSAGSAEPETAYHGDYATPVLGTDSQRRMVGPPAVAGGVRTEPVAAPVPAAAPPQATATAGGPSPAPAFAFSAADEAQRRKRAERTARREAQAARRRPPWISRSLAAAALIAVVVLSLLLVDARRDVHESEEFATTWTQLSVSPDATLVSGVSDNGQWSAVITPMGLALSASEVSEYSDDEVLQLWGEVDGDPVDLGPLEVGADGSIEFRAETAVDSLFVTRESAPGAQSGTPSKRLVASLDPALMDS
jgi:hypothetical protein